MKKQIIGVVLTTLLSASALATEVSTYLYAKYSDASSVVSTLKSNGFDVLGEYDAMSNGNYHVIAFTNNSLKQNASKESRGFAGIMKVLVSQEDSQLVFTNPNYFLSAFLQDDFSKESADDVRLSLASAFGELKGSSEALDDDDIAGYHFMFGMPYYEDMIEIAEGENLLDTIKNNAGDKLVFELKLNSSTVFGIAMDGDNGEKNYIPTISGQKHTAFAPYMILVEGNSAKIMHAKYYLALSFPNLSMGEFMDISDAPDNIEEFMQAIATAK